MHSLLHKLGSNWLRSLLFLVILSASTVFLLKPIYDNDFFWHLKLGEWIWNNGRLPDRDLFNFTTPAAVTPAVRFTLTSYWLSQVIIYFAFLSNGMGGIVVMRFILTAIIVYIMMRRLQGDEIINASLLVLFITLLLNFYFIERPQTFSFLFFGVQLFILERLKEKSLSSNGMPVTPVEYRLVFSLAIVMLLWSNSHGGHLIGQVTLLVYLVMEALKFFHRKLTPMTPRGYGRLFIAGTIGLIFSLFNPNTYQALLLMLQSSAGDPSNNIQEYSSMPEFYHMTSNRLIILVYLAVMILTVLVVVAFPKSTDITEVVLLTGIGYFAFMHVRYAAFFPIAALPLLGRQLSNRIVAPWGRRILPPLVMCTVIFAVSTEFRSNIATAQEGRWVNERLFPVKAADFILANKLQGNMYNDYGWGGYLIWRLGPERKVFSDGRNLNSEALLHNYLIDTVQIKYDTNELVWKSLLHKYDINYIVTFSRTQSGQVTPLTNALLSDSEWVPVFSHRASRSVIFTRNIPDNYAVISNRSFEGV